MKYEGGKGVMIPSSKVCSDFRWTTASIFRVLVHVDTKQ